MGWIGFGCDEGAQGRAKGKHSGFIAVPSFLPCCKLRSLSSLLGVCLHSHITHYRHRKFLKNKNEKRLFHICVRLFSMLCLETERLGINMG